MLFYLLSEKLSLVDNSYISYLFVFGTGICICIVFNTHILWVDVCIMHLCFAVCMFNVLCDLLPFFTVHDAHFAVMSAGN